jgi:SSS family solute:Na+ symporter
MFLLGIFSRKANRQGINVGIAACVLFTFYAFLTSTPIGLAGKEKLIIDLGRLNFTQHKYMIGVYSHIVLMIVGYLSSLLFRSEPVEDSLTWYGWLKLKKLNSTR